MAAAVDTNCSQNTPRLTRSAFNGSKSTTDDGSSAPIMPVPSVPTDPDTGKTPPVATSPNAASPSPTKKSPEPHSSVLISLSVPSNGFRDTGVAGIRPAGRLPLPLPAAAASMSALHARPRDPTAAAAALLSRAAAEDGIDDVPGRPPVPSAEPAAERPRGGDGEGERERDASERSKASWASWLARLRCSATRACSLVDVSDSSEGSL